MRNIGVVISNSEPEKNNCDAWLNPGTGKWYQLENNEWTEKGNFVINWTDLAGKPDSFPPDEHSHSDLDDIVTLLNSGVTGSRTIQGYTLTFNHGVLTGFQAP